MCYVLVQLSALLLLCFRIHCLFSFVTFSSISSYFHSISSYFVSFHFTTVISCCFTSFHQMVCHSSSLLSQFTHLILSFILYRSTSIYLIIHSIRSLNASIHWFIRSTKGFILNQIHFIHSFFAFIRSLHSFVPCIHSIMNSLWPLVPLCTRHHIYISRLFAPHVYKPEWMVVRGRNSSLPVARPRESGNS